MENKYCADCGKVYRLYEDGLDLYIDGLGVVGPCCIMNFEPDELWDL